MLLVSGATTTIRPLVETEPAIFGTLTVPADGNSLSELGRWAGDNGAFTRFDEPAFRTMLAKHRWARARCLFVAAPDDGLTWAGTPWDQLDAIFIGGSTGYKLGAEAARLVVEAHLIGKWAHMGRVNTARRLQYAAAVGVDSVDGSGWSRFPADMIRRHGALLRTLSQQRRMVLEVTA